MSVLEAIAIFTAGLAAGAINGVVGSGTLITFPVLLGLGYPPVLANVSNTIGLVPGSLASAIGYRHELAGQRGRILRYGAASLAGGTAGAVLLLTLPASAFDAIVPGFIALALVLIVVQPRLVRWVAAHRRVLRRDGGPGTLAAVLGSGVYGGYFGAAQGILLVAILGVGVQDELQRVNALKVVLAMLVNLVAGVLFVFVADVAWAAVLLIAAGSIVGGDLGVRVGRRLPPNALRGVIVVVGGLAIARLLA